ncbi:MAG: class I SAM-dependent methyltransferase [Ekhidna sp.]|nr:class I SAM-dependent methyltransferase [Ekhidna sp.]
MYQRIEQCPICGHKEFTNLLICEDHTVSNESFAIVKCNSCDFHLTNPRPTEERLPHYYKSNQYISHTDKANNLINFIYKLVRSHTLRNKEKLIRDIAGSPSTLLDFGCGTGHFLREASERGWKARGYEPDPMARTIANSKNQGTVTDNLEALAGKFNIITAWHVIEHVPKLMETLKTLRKLLQPGGTLVIAVPNHKSLDAEIYNSHWAAYDVPRHLFHFDRQSMKKLAKNLRMKVVDTKPMKFDSYYVSLLSEKYKGTGSTTKALLNGFKSNQSAKTTGEYSSLIYTLQK